MGMAAVLFLLNIFHKEQKATKSVKNTSALTKSKHSNKKKE